MATAPSNFKFWVILGLVLSLMTIVVFHRAEARALLVFGDSLVDSGNNNYLATTARADSPPYGIDYPTRRPTGRFSNGLNIPDIISMFLIYVHALMSLTGTCLLILFACNVRRANWPIRTAIAILKPRAHWKKPS